MRVYIPASRTLVRDVVRGEDLHAGRGFAATAELLEAYGLEPGDEEIAEAIAMALAAHASRALVGTADETRGLRVVLAADVPDAQPIGEDDVGAVGWTAALPASAVASLHIDPMPAPAAAEDELDDVTQLLWYDRDEAAGLVTQWDQEGTTHA